MEDPHAVVGDAPVLYVADGSLPCQVARLVLVEKGVHHSVRGLNTGALEQLEDWYLKASPKGAMPVLLHAGKPVVEEDAVVRYADKTFPGDSIAGDAGALDKFAKLAHDVPGDHFVATAFLKDNHPVAKVVLPQIAESHLAKLKAHKEAHKENKLVSDATDAEIAVTEDKLAKYKEPEPAFESAKKALDTLLDEVDKALEKHGESKPEAPKFLCGDKFTLVDCVVVPLLARVQWAGPGREAVHARPRVEAYYHAASARKGFSEADVWTGIKPLSAAVVLSGVAIDSVVALADLAGKEWNEHVAPPLGAAWQKVSDGAKSAGDAINEHVIKPVSETPAVKAAQLAYDTQVLPRLRDAAKSTGDFLNDKVLTPVKDGADKAGHAFSEAAEKAKEAAKEAYEATKHAAEEAAHKAAEAAHDAAERAKHMASGDKHDDKKDEKDSEHHEKEARDEKAHEEALKEGKQ